MGNEAYVNHYVQVLNDSLVDAVARNMSLQANLKVSDDMLRAMEAEINGLKEQKNESEVQKEYIYQQRKTELENTFVGKEQELKNTIDDLQKKLSSIDPNREVSLKSEIDALKNSIKMYENNVTVLTKEKEEWDRTKHQLTHLETFRNELAKCQNDLSEKEKVIQSKQQELDKLIAANDKKLADKDTTISQLKDEISRLTAVEVPVVEEVKQFEDTSDLTNKFFANKKKKSKIEPTVADGGKF